MASNLKKIVSLYNSTSLIARIVVGLIIGLVLGLVCPGAQWVALLGDLFVGALKAIAPVLVFALVSSALVQGQEKLDNRFALVNVIFAERIKRFIAQCNAETGLDLIECSDNCTVIASECILTHRITDEIFPRAFGVQFAVIFGSRIIRDRKITVKKEIRIHVNAVIAQKRGGSE